MELYKKHRPRSLKAVAGNEETVRTLKNLLANDRLPHTILLSGPSGCGKTTIARILKDELGCAEQDFVELNCADFRGIDTIREINRNMFLSPLMGSCRIWLIDECHKLSNDAQNAFLKALEDTPSHVYFILATTDPNKLIQTIRTRSCELPVTPLDDVQMGKLLRKVCSREKVEVPEPVIDVIVERSYGSARMALVLLDKVYDLEESDMILAVEQEAIRQNQSIELARELLRGSPWSTISSILKGLEEEPETIRRVIRGYCSSVLTGKSKQGVMDRAFVIMEETDGPFFDDGKNKLVQTCYSVVRGSSI